MSLGNVHVPAKSAPQEARDARAHAWRFVFDCYEKKKATRPGGPDDGTKIKEDSANAIIPAERP